MNWDYSAISRDGIESLAREFNATVRVREDGVLFLSRLFPHASKMLVLKFKPYRGMYYIPSLTSPSRFRSLEVLHT